MCICILQDSCRQIQVCVAKTLQLLDQQKHEEEMISYLTDAANQGSGIAAFMLWEQMKSKLSVRMTFNQKYPNIILLLNMDINKKIMILFYTHTMIRLEGMKHYN